VAEVSVAGKVLDASALLVWTEGRVAIQAWVGVARTRGLTLLLPELARVEILMLRPDATGLVDDLATHPHVLVAELTAGGRSAIETRFADTGTCDVLAAWVVQACHQRGWSALSADPGRLHRLDPRLEVDLL
jgi:hypothetical protein